MLITLEKFDKICARLPEEKQLFLEKQAHFHERLVFDEWKKQLGIVECVSFADDEAVSCAIRRIFEEAGVCPCFFGCRCGRQ